MGSIIQVKKDDRYVDVPVLRGKSAYEHAISGGLLDTIDEETFNKMLGNMVYGAGADNTVYQINVTGQEPDDNTPDNVITIVLES